MAQLCRRLRKACFGLMRKMYRRAGETWACNQRGSRRIGHTFGRQQIKRQIDAVARCILIQIAQDIH